MPLLLSPDASGPGGTVPGARKTLLQSSGTRKVLLTESRRTSGAHVLPHRIAACGEAVAFVEIIPLSKCIKDGGVFVSTADRDLAVFRLREPERIFVIDNACPHAGGNLSGGEVHEGIVACRWHDWRFHLDTGVCTHSERVRVRRYPAEVRDGVVWADLPATPKS